LLEEQNDLQNFYKDYQSLSIVRLSFWNDSRPIGYAIVKHDAATRSDSVYIDRWHVFEAVMPKYDHRHNCIRKSKNFSVLLNEIECLCQAEGYRTILIEAHEEKRLPALLAPHLRRLLFDLDRVKSAGDNVRRGIGILKRAQRILAIWK